MSTTGDIATSAPRRPRPDYGLYAILAANVLTLVIAVWRDWSMIELVFPFWMQSIVIGFYARRRILKLRQFTTDDMLVNGKRVDPTAKTQRWIANFFTLHYGLFHLFYLMFIGVFVGSGSADAAPAEPQLVEQRYIYAAIALSFLISHGASHREHVAADLAGKPNIGTLMFIPYIRIVPMHLTIMLGAMAGGASAIYAFMALKTAADLGMHWVEHRVLAGKPDKSDKSDKSSSKVVTRQGHDAVYGHLQSPPRRHGRRTARKRR
jgi:hypothetical protein